MARPSGLAGVFLVGALAIGVAAPTAAVLPALAPSAQDVQDAVAAADPASVAAAADDVVTADELPAAPQLPPVTPEQHAAAEAAAAAGQASPEEPPAPPAADEVPRTPVTADAPAAVVEDLARAEDVARAAARHAAADTYVIPPDRRPDGVPVRRTLQHERRTSADPLAGLSGGGLGRGSAAASTSDGALTGRLTDAVSGAGVAGACVITYAYGDDTERSTCADATGAYRLALPAGTYWALVEDQVSSHITEYLGEVVISAGSDTVVDVVLQPGASISGIITGPGGSPLEGVCVSLVDLHWGEYMAGGCTGSDGRYRTTGTQVDDYRVHIIDDLGTHLPEWYDDAATVDAAAVLALGLGDRTGVDAQLAQGGWLEGTVVADGTGAPIDGHCTTVYTAAGEYVHYRCHDTSAWTSGGLLGGDYVVEVDDTAGRYLGEYVEDASSAKDAQRFPVVLGQGTTGVRASLALGGSITGRVTDASTGAAVNGACVSVSGMSSSGNGYGYGCSDADGRYDVGGLATGEYVVSFYGSGDYLDEHYDDAADWSTATKVPVTVGSATGGIDAGLALGGSVRGTVTDAATGQPVRGICVSTEAASGYSSSYRSSCSDQAGTYHIRKVVPGQHHVRFSGEHSEYLTQYWQGAASQADATPVTVTGGGAVTDGIGAALVRGGVITGTVTDERTGEPTSACVSAYRGDETWSTRYACTQGGTYRLAGLPAGDYRVEFQPTSGGQLALEWYADKRTRAEADLVTVALGAERAGISAALAEGLSITGQVTTGDGGPLPPSTCVSATRADGTGGGAGTCELAPDGTYRLGGLQPGTYTVYFSAYGSGYEDQWFDGATSYASATPVVVETAVTGVGAVLRRAASLAGTVTGPDGRPLAGACLGAYLASSTSSPVATTCVDAEGRYTMSGLTAGTYLVRATDPGGVHARQWYRDAATAADADPVAVPASTAVTGIDLQLHVGSRISGRITGRDSGLPVAGVCVYGYGPGLGYFTEKLGCSGADGTYRTLALAEGQYELSYDAREVQDLVYQTYRPYCCGTGLQLGRGVDRTDVDAALEPGAMVSGTVRDEVTGTAIYGACIHVQRADAPEDHGSVGSTCQYSSGYSLVVPPGDHKVRFHKDTWAGGQPYVLEWHEDQPDKASAQVVRLLAHERRTAFDARLSPAAAGTVTATVVDAATGQPVPACLRLSGPGEHYGRQVGCAGSSGQLTAQVEPGTYRATFTSHSGGYLDLVLPTDVVVRTGETTHLDARMEKGAALRGTVRDAGTGAPLRNVCVELVPLDGNHLDSTYRCTGDDGVFTTGGAPAGQYRLLLTNYGGRYVPEWYDDAAVAEAAQVFTLAAGQLVDGLVVDMALGGTVSGRITGPDGSPLGGVCVEVLTPAGQFGGFGGCTDSDGRYRTAGLRTGEYVLRFVDHSGVHRAEFFDDVQDLAAATRISVVSGQDRTADAVLAPDRQPLPRVRGDYDGDGLADVAVFRPDADGAGNARWFVQHSSGGTDEPFWGSSTDVPVPADYDGDGRYDVAVFRPDGDGSGGARWFVRRSSDGAVVDAFWGSATDRPVTGDFDGDGQDDLAVFRATTGQWIARLSGGGVLDTHWGGAGDVPVAADFDGDGTTDLAVFRPDADGAGSGRWFVRLSSTGSTLDRWWGGAGDVPVAADFDGDGQADVAVLRPDADGAGASRWFISGSAGGELSPFWGSTGDHLAPADYDGDGRTDIGSVRPGAVFQWWQLRGDGSVAAPFWGGGDDVVLSARG